MGRLGDAGHPDSHALGQGGLRRARRQDPRAPPRADRATGAGGGVRPAVPRAAAFGDAAAVSDAALRGSRGVRGRRL